MVVLASMKVKPTTVIVNSPGARPLTAPFATNCHSAKCFTIRSIGTSEIRRSTVMSGQWPQPNKTISKKAQSEIAFDAYPRARIPVRQLHYSPRDEGADSTFFLKVVGLNSRHS